MNNSLHTLNALIAEHVTFKNFKIIWRDSFGLGDFYPEVWDEFAERENNGTRNARLLGAAWRKGYDRDGNITELYTCTVPGYTGNWDAFQHLLNAIANDNKFLCLAQVPNGWEIFVDGLKFDFPDQQHSVLAGACMAILKAYEVNVDFSDLTLNRFF